MDVHPPKNGINRYWSIPNCSMPPIQQRHRVLLLRAHIWNKHCGQTLLQRWVSIWGPKTELPTWDLYDVAISYGSGIIRDHHPISLFETTHARSSRKMVWPGPNSRCSKFLLSRVLKLCTNGHIKLMFLVSNHPLLEHIILIGPYHLFGGLWF
jgi:hypothetical protein